MFWNLRGTRGRNRRMLSIPALCLLESEGFFSSGDAMKRTMQAVTISRIGSFTHGIREVPRPGLGEVLVRVALTGLCRTDLKIIRSGHRDLTMPRIPGEEVVGVVEECGDSNPALQPGTRVYVYPGDSCGNCIMCRTGAENLCRSMQIMGFHRDGGFAGYLLAPIKSLIPLQDTCSFSDAVFAEPLSCCINALEMARLASGERIAVWGAGPAGTLLKRLAESMGAVANVIEPDPVRRSAIGGLESAGDNRFNVCIPAVGTPDAYHDALDHLAPRGRLVVFSGLPASPPQPAVDLNTLHYHEQTVVGAYGCSLRHGIRALELISSGAVPVADLVSHTMPLCCLGEALDMVAERRCMKIHLNPWEK